MFHADDSDQRRKTYESEDEEAVQRSVFQQSDLYDINRAQKKYSSAVQEILALLPPHYLGEWEVIIERCTDSATLETQHVCSIRKVESVGSGHKRWHSLSSWVLDNVPQARSRRDEEFFQWSSDAMEKRISHVVCTRMQECEKDMLRKVEEAVKNSAKSKVDSIMQEIRDSFFSGSNSWMNNLYRRGQAWFSENLNSFVTAVVQRSIKDVPVAIFEGQE